MRLFDEKVTVFAASLPWEAQYLSEKIFKMENIVSKDGFSISAGYWRERPVLVLVSGVGSARAALAHQFVHSNFNVKRVVIFGLAGALRKGMKVGDIVIPEAAGLVGGEQADFKPLEMVPTAHDYDGDVFCGGVVLQSDKPLGPREKMALAVGNAVCVDMESHTASSIARLHGVPCSVIRAISDEIDTVVDLAKPKGDARFMAAAKVAAERNSIFIEKAMTANIGAVFS